MCDMMKTKALYRWRFLAMTMILLRTINARTSEGGKEKKSPPHIIFILADDLGWNDVSWHNPKVQTPNMERLAKTGIILEQSYVLPKCTPTRAALLTGKHPYTFGRQGRVIKPMEPAGLPIRLKLLPQALKKAGYATHAVGKWHLGFCSKAYLPTERGFDSFYGFYGGSESHFSHSLSGGIPPEKQRGCKKDCHIYGLDLRNNTKPDPTKNGIYSTDLFSSRVEELLRSRNSQKPLFLYLALQSVHAPREVPRDYYVKTFAHIKDIKRRKYLGMVLAMDEAVGRVVEALKTSGHYKNSVIIFTSDNGGAIRGGGNSWPLCGSKGTLLEGGTRATTFVHSPLLKKSFISHKLMHVTDWFNTLVSLAGGNIPADTDGYDQWKALSTPAAPSPRNKMVYNIDNSELFLAAVRHDKFKLLIGDVESKREWIYPPENLNVRRHNGTNIVNLSLPATMNTFDFSEMKAKHKNISVVSDSLYDSDNWMSEETKTLETTGDTPLVIGYLGDSVIQSARKHSDFTKNSIEYNTTNTSGTISIQKGYIDFNNNNIRSPEILLTDEINTKIFDIQEYRLKNITFKHDGIYGERLARRKELVTLEKNIVPKIKIAKDDWVTFRELGVNTKRYHRLKNFINQKTKVILCNIKVDPEERHNLAKMKVSKVKELLNYLNRKMKDFVPPKILPDKPRANPRYWNNAWSSGWCQAT